MIFTIYIMKLTSLFDCSFDFRGDRNRSLALGPRVEVKDEFFAHKIPIIMYESNA